jgi:hypothetical protein
MVEAKRRADAENARANAPEKYAQAEAIEKAAAAAFAAQDSANAARQYREATVLYDEAAEDAKARAADPNWASAQTALKNMEGAKAKLSQLGEKKPDATSMKWASDEEKKAREALAAKKYTQAARFFENARKLYEKAAALAK